MMIINEEELAQTRMLFDRAVFGSLSLHIVRWQKQLFIHIKEMKNKNDSDSVKSQQQLIEGASYCEVEALQTRKISARCLSVWQLYCIIEGDSIIHDG